MKTINVTFDEEEYDDLLKRKGETSWHNYILSINKKEGDKNVRSM